MREVVHEVEVRVARTGATDAHHDLAGTGLGVGDLDQLRVVLPLAVSRRARTAQQHPPQGPEPCHW